MTATISKANRFQRADVIRLLAAQLAEHSIELAEKELARTIDGIFDDPSRGVLHVAWLEEKVIGVSYLSFIWALEHGGRSAWLEELYVLPEYREKGTGKKLIEANIAYATAEGCAAVDLEVESDHKRVEKLYSRNG